MRSRALRRALIAALGLAAVLGGTIAALAAAPAKPGLTLQISPASTSVTRGQSAGYTVSVTSTGGFAGTVTLTASGLPSGATATFAPASVSLGSGATVSSTLSVATTSSTPVGSSTFTITGTSGKVSGTVTAGLTVNYPLSSALTMAVTPASVTMGPGATAVYTMQLSRSNLAGPVQFAVLGGLPSGATGTYSPNPTTGNSVTFQVATTPSAADDSYTLNLVASGSDASGTTRYAYASVQLVISTSGKPFMISGNLPGVLSPGASRALNLLLANPNNKTVAITNLTVTVQSVRRAAAAVGACTVGDYAITQYTGPYPLTVPRQSSASLSDLGVAAQYWPQVRMLNAPTNQDGCKGAAVSLAYSGSGQG